MRQHLEQQVQQQRSSAALQSGAQPLNELLVLSAELLVLQANCCSKADTVYQDDASTTEIKSILGSAASLTGTSAAVTAMWRCESVLQACLGAAAGTVKMGKCSLPISLRKVTAVCTAQFVMQCSTMVEASPFRPDQAAVAAAVAAVSLDAILEVLLAYTALLAAFMHKDQEAKPPALPGGALSSVPPSHEALLQAVGLAMNLPRGQRLPGDISQLSVAAGLLQCLPALDWTLQRLCARLRDDAAASSSQHTASGGNCSSGCGSSSAAIPAPAAGSSRSSTASRLCPNSTPASNGHSSGGAASFYSMRLLPLLPALLSELVALQPQSAEVLNSVLSVSTICLSIGEQLQQAARAQQAIQLGSGSRFGDAGLAILQGLFRAGLEVYVPVQQRLAAPYGSIEDLNASRGDAALTDITWVDNDAESGVTKLYSGQAENLGDPLFGLLAASLAAFDHQHGE